MSFSVIIILIAELLLIVFACYLIFSFINKTPFYPSSIKEFDELRKSGIINFEKYKNFIDIGSGDGRIVRWAAKNGFESAHGIDYNPYLTLYSRVRSFRNPKVNIFNKFFQKHEYSNYDFAYMYIFSENINQMKDTLFSQMKKDGVIVTNTFKISDLEPDEKYKSFYIYYIK